MATTKYSSNDVTDCVVAKAHCDWITQQVAELKSLLGHNSRTMIVLNKTRALSAISTMEHALSELKHMIEEQ